MQGRVIIIEDEEELGQLLQLYLGRETVDAPLCSTAEEGLELFRQTGADLIVLDINLPGMDGFEFLQALRRESTVPVVIVSAREADEDIVMGLGIGADEFVTKPFAPVVLVARIRALLRRSRAMKPVTVSFGPYVMDVEGYSLTRSGTRAVLLAFDGRVDPEDRPAILDNLRLADAIGRLSRLGGDPERIRETLKEASPAASLLIFDAEKRPVYSSFEIESFPDFLDLGSKSRRYSIHRTNVAAPDGRNYTAVIGFPGRDIYPGPLQGIVLPTVLGSVVGFMALMSILIIRSINRSINRLEEATRRISEGGLGFRLEARGNDRIASLTRSFDAIRDGLAVEPGRMEKYLSIIRGKVDILVSRISQLIDYVKLETSEWKRSREDLSLAPFLDEAATVFATEAEARGFGFESSLAVDGKLTVSMDVDLVHRALENLARNAFQHAEPGSAIAFRAEPGDGCVTLRVSNRGRGIDGKDRPFLFEPFYRGSGSRRQTGFGLGLSVAKSVVSSHGRDVSVRSDDGETSFVSMIPVRETADGGGNIP